MAGGVDVAERGAPADAVGVVESVGADAGGVGVVVVRVGGEASVEAGVVEGDLVGEQVFELVAAGDDGPSLPWKSSWKSMSVSSLR